MFIYHSPDNASLICIQFRNVFFTNDAIHIHESVYDVGFDEIKQYHF